VPAQTWPDFRPLADAKAGEWCRFGLRDEQVEELRVKGIEGDAVAIEVRMFRAGQPLGLPAVRVERASFNPLRQHESRLTIAVTTEPATVEAAGYSWPCRLVTETWIDEEVPTVRKTWICEAAPVFGIVRSERYDEGKRVAFMELLDFGPK
jgi:hypothetical protein